MARFEIGEYAQVIETGRIGFVTDRNRTKVFVTFYDKDMVIPETLEFQAYKLKPVEIKALNRSQLRPLVRGELTLKEVSEGTNLLPEYVEIDGKTYHATAEDLLAGIEHFEKRPGHEIYAWLDVLNQFEVELGLDCFHPEIRDEITESDYVSMAYAELNEAYFVYMDKPVDISSYIRDAKDILKDYTEHRDEIPDYMARKMVNQFDDDSIDSESEKTQELFKKCLDLLCDKKDSKAIQKRGYCYYTGTKIYPNDWVKARDAFIEYYALSGDASAANTLGYIYYYGRTNGGVPQYEEAFRYFSIGHAYGYYESTYKLADMFTHGYGVVKDEETAYRLYDFVYNENVKRFKNGEFGGKFADAALRMGNCYSKGIFVDKDPREAYTYYLEAELAIKKRIEDGNHYGDTVVLNSIKKALEETRKEFTDYKRSFIYDNYPYWVAAVLSDNRCGKISIKEQKDGALRLKVKNVRKPYEEYAPGILVAFPEADYSALLDEMIVKTAKDSTYDILNGRDEIIFDAVNYDWNTGEAKFTLAGILMGIIKTSQYKITIPKKKEAPKEGQKYHFVSVAFTEGSRTYDYICEDESVKEGDIVIVPGYEGEVELPVLKSFDQYESELALPIERYKKVKAK